MQAGFLSKKARQCGGWLAGVALACAAAGASAYTVSITPASQTVVLGAQVEVAITTGDVVGDGGLGSFDFVVGYDSSILTFDRVDMASVLGTTFGFDTFSEVGSAGSFSISHIFDDLPAALLALQTNEFLQRNDAVLFTLRFNTLSAGTSLLSFTDVFLSDVEGNNQKSLALGEIGATGASVTVQERVQGVPTPGTLPLLAAALLAAACMPRRRA